jgi:hypothetical protein
MLTTARQFFDIWAECVSAVGSGRRYGDSLAKIFKKDAVAIIRERHGGKIAAYAEAYYERLRADARSGISSL